MNKPVRLEFNNSGAWKVLGRFDASDEDQAALVMDAAEQLVQTLNNGGPAKRCPTLRISIDTPGDSATVLARWALELGWRDAQTGEPL